jgi:hypothetical protein
VSRLSPSDPRSSPPLAGTRTAFAAAAVVALAACGPRARPDGAEPAPEPERAAALAMAPPGRGVLVGEMCPQGAAGRPAVAPLLVRGVGWSADPDDVAAALERSARAFAVLGHDGTRAGIFEVLGAAEIGLASEVAIGSYAGRSPCAPATHDGGAEPDAACTRATGGCGLAIASIEPGGDGVTLPEVVAGAACAAGGSLVVDVDGDGVPEAFTIAQFVDAERAPAEEVTATLVAAPSCTEAFAIYGLVVAPPPEAGVADDPRYHVTLDVIAVADLDGNGRREVVISFRYPHGRTIALYSAVRHAGRLDLVGEAEPWH